MEDIENKVDEVDEVINLIVEKVTNAVVEKVFNDERFLNLNKKEDNGEIVEETNEIIEETPAVVEEEKDTRTTIEKIRDRLRGIK